MARIINIQYTLSPQIQAKQWVSEELKLTHALKPVQKTLRGEIADSAWSRYEHFAWQHSDGVWSLRTDSVPVKTLMHGRVEVTINPMHRVGVVFQMAETKRAWNATRVYEDPAELLEALRRQTLHDFADPRVQETVSHELNSVLSSLYAEWDLPNLEDKFASYALRIGKLVHEYHPQWVDLDWCVKGTDGEPLPSGSYRWHGNAPLHHEALRLLYYVTQSFSFLDKNDGSLWVKPPTVMAETLDLAFLSMRMYSARDSKKEVQVKRDKKLYHPGEADNAIAWFQSVKSFVSTQAMACTDETILRIIWNTAVVFDYIPKISPDNEMSWSATSVRAFLTQPEYRSDAMKMIPALALNHNTYLDEAVQFWEHGGYSGLGHVAKQATAQAVNTLRDYFVWTAATAEGLNFPAIPIYKEADILSARRRYHGSEVIKKIEPMLQALEDSGPLKYSALVSNIDVLDSLMVCFPNFKEVTLQIQKQLRLARLQPHPVIRLHPILIVGDPGWGKTRFLKALSDALRLPFTEIPMSSVTAGFVLSGGDLMWHAAKHGKIADIFMHGNCINPMIVLDELDKVGSDNRHDPYGPLYQLLERHTAARFMDEALNVPLDTQYISWCATANSIESIPEPILSRFDIFEIPALSRDETPLVAQSIYDDLLNENLWGAAFDPVLSLSFCARLHGMNARAMYFALRGACANASARDERPLVLVVDDLEVKRSRKLAMGFSAPIV